MLLLKFDITENSVFWIFSQNDLSESDCRIIKLATSQEKIGVTMHLAVFFIWCVQSHVHAPAHMLLLFIKLIVWDIRMKKMKERSEP